jgi:hypothetical protein
LAQSKSLSLEVIHFGASIGRSPTGTAANNVYSGNGHMGNDANERVAVLPQDVIAAVLGNDDDVLITFWKRFKLPKAAWKSKCIIAVVLPAPVGPIAIVFRNKYLSRSARFFFFASFLLRFAEEPPAPAPAPELITMGLRFCSLPTQGLCKPLLTKQWTKQHVHGTGLVICCFAFAKSSLRRLLTPAFALTPVCVFQLLCVKAKGIRFCYPALHFLQCHVTSAT